MRNGDCQSCDIQCLPLSEIVATPLFLPVFPSMIGDRVGQPAENPPDFAKWLNLPTSGLRPCAVFGCKPIEIPQELLSHECLPPPPPPCDLLVSQSPSGARACATALSLETCRSMANSLVMPNSAGLVPDSSPKVDSAPCGVLCQAPECKLRLNN